MRALLQRLVRRAVHADAFEVLHRSRVDALESQLGKCDGMVLRPRGRLAIGFSDVLRFHHYVHGVTYATCDLIGDDRQQPNRFGHYELMICTRQEEEWAPRIISRVAGWTRRSILNPGELMELGDHAPEDSQIAGFLFDTPETEHPYFSVMGYAASLVLCIGVTRRELDSAREHGPGPLLRALRENHVFPYTDLYRESLA